MSKINKLLSGFLAMVFVLTSFGSLAVSADEAEEATAEVTAEESVTEETVTEEAESKPIVYDGTYNVRGFDGGVYDDSKHRDGGYDAGYDPDYDYTKDEGQEVKFLIDENFSFNKLINHQGETFKAPSGWDARNLGGSFTDRYFFHQGLVDTSEKFPVELNRKFETVNHGKLTLDFVYVPLEKAQDGISFTLGEAGTAAVKYITRENGLYLQQPDGKEVFVAEYNVRPTDEGEKSWGTEETVYNNGIRTIVNMDTKTIEKVIADGMLVLENLPFLNDVDAVDNFNINTGDKNTGKLWMRSVKLHRGYIMYDQFIETKLNVPTAYNAEGNVSMMNMQSSSPWDYTNMVMETGSRITRNVDKVENNQMAFEFSFYQPEKSNGFQLNVKGNGAETLGFRIHDNKFWYVTNGTEKELYSDYFQGVWYKFRAYMDLETKKADIYVNGIKRAENVDIYNNAIDSVQAYNEGSSIYTDFFKMWYDEPEPEDYCPEPQPATPKDPNMLVGMQFCPMWRNGYHVGWDSLNMYKEHVPYLGYYDEGDPEVNDWMIKQLVEHGFNFQRVTIVADTPGPYENPTFGWSFIDEGLKYSKYKSMLPYCVLMETGSVYHPSREWFLNHYLTYMIEHYFKDPDYLRINGRPVLSCWTSNNFFAYAGTADDVKTPLADKIPLCQEFLKEVRQKCIDAGVGNPIIAMNLGPNADTLQLYKEIGIDCSMPYSSSDGATVSGQIKDIDKSIENKDILDKTIAFSPGYAGQPWQFTSSGVIKADNFKKILDYYVSVRDQFDKDSLAHNFICLDTYDEYGEGHWVAPSGGQGWGFFDAVYEAFCEKDSDAHDHDYAHQVPTTAQKDRFNNLYPPNRRLETVDVVESAPEEPLDGSTVAKGWYFEEGAEGWNAGVDLSPLSIKDGCLSGTVTGRDSQIYSPTLDFDYHGITHVKIRIKYDVQEKNYVGGNQLFFTTYDGMGLSEQKAARRSGPWSKVSGDNGFVDIYYPIAGSNLVDNLKQIRFDVIDGNPKDANDANFMIDSIELIYHKDFDKSEAEKYDFDNAPSYVTINDEVQALKSAPVKEGEKWYYPIRELSVKLGGKVDYDWLNDRTTILYGEGYAQIDNATQKATINGGTLRAKPVVIERDGTSYVTEKFYEQLFGISLNYDEATRMIEFTQSEQNANKQREIIYSSEFDVDGDVEGWYNYQCVGQLGVSNGNLTGKVTGKMPMLAKSGLSIKTSDVKNIQVAIANNTDVDSIKFYFTTEESGNMDETKSMSAKVKNDGKMKIVDIDPSTCKGWTGTVKFLRFDPGSNADAGDFTIDYIRFEGDWQAVEGASSVTENEYEYSWYFDANSTKDGWIFSKQFGDCKVEDGILSATVIGPSPKLYTVADLGIDSSKISEIEVKFKNSSDGTKAKLMFLMDKQAEFEKGPSVEFDINANDPESTSYIIPVSDIEGFDGKLNSICFMPTDGNGSVEIDYFTLVYAQE